MLAWQVFKSNDTPLASSSYLNDAILQGIDGLQRLLIYDRSLQPAGELPVFKRNLFGSSLVIGKLLSFMSQI